MDVLNLIRDSDVFFACETWSKSKCEFNNTVPGYRAFAALRHFPDEHTGRGHGGLVIFVKTVLCKYVTILESSSNNILWLLLSTKFEIVLFAVVYFSPKNSTGVDAKEDLFSTLFDELSSHRSTYDVTQTYICGDLNCRTGVHLEKSIDISAGEDVFLESITRPMRTSKDSTIDNRGIELLELCSVSDLTIANGRFGSDKDVGDYTCIRYNGASVVDYLLIDGHKQNLLRSFDIRSLTESDHLPLKFSFELRTGWDFDFDLQENETFSMTSIRQPDRIVWNNERLNSFLSKLQSDETFEMCTEFLNKCSRNELNEAIEQLDSIMRFCASDMIRKPRKPTSRKFCQPWFDDECTVAKRLTKSKLRRFRANRKNDRLLSEYIETKKHYKVLIQERKLRYKNERTRLLNFAITGNNPNSFWSFFKGKKQVEHSISPTQWYEYFKTLYENLFHDHNLPALDDVTMRYDQHMEIFDSAIGDVEIVSAIKGMKSGKAAGLDGIVMECWKNSPDCVNLLVVLFNKLYSLGVYPDSWRTSIIVPVPKKGDLTDPNNYRGICLTPSLSKIYASILNTRLVKWGEANSFFSDAQFGFRKKRSTIDCVFVLHTAVSSSQLARPKKTVYCAFIDLLKAFDCVPRNLLIHKLRSFGISQKFLTTISQMYEDVRASVRCESCITLSFPCPAGVKQGCVLSSSLFTSFLNDLETFLISQGVGSLRLETKRLIILLYADDLVIFDTTVGGLQRKLNYLCDFVQHWGLKINIQKSKIMKFEPGRLGKKEIWHINGEKVEIVREFEYLGVNLSCSNSWAKARTQQINKAKRATFCILAGLNSFGRISRKILMKIFDFKISAILLYGCELWGFGDLNDVEKVASRYYKLTLGLPLNTSNDLARGELGRYTLKCTVYKRIIKYWFKLLDSEPETFIHAAYQVQLNLAEQNKDCWALKLKKMLFCLGYGNVWFQQGVGNVPAFLHDFSTRVRDIDRQEWHDRISTYGTLRTYRNIKHELFFEPYVDLELPSRTIKTFTKLRGGLLHMEVNEGRWAMPPIEYSQRKCRLCNHNKVEDEEHMLFHCPVWTVYRNQLNIYPSFKNKNLEAVCSTLDVSLIRDLVKFLDQVLMEKSEILEIL